MGNDGTIVPYLDEITEAFLEEVRTAHPSALVLSGDLSQNGEKANHEALAEKLERVQAAGIPVLVIPGNHDIQNKNASTYFGTQREKAEYLETMILTIRGRQRILMIRYLRQREQVRKSFTRFTISLAMIRRCPGLRIR